MKPKPKPWQTSHMNQYRAIRNMMLYWFARMILNQGGEDSTAYSNHMLPAERRAIRQYCERKRYWRERKEGLSGSEIYARRQHKTLSQYSKEQRAYRKARREKWGGDPRPGTEAYNRWFIATMLNGKPKRGR